MGTQCPSANSIALSKAGVLCHISESVIRFGTITYLKLNETLQDRYLPGMVTSNLDLLRGSVEVGRKLTYQ